MRILLVTTWFPSAGQPAVGSFVMRDAQAIAEYGHDVQVVHLRPGVSPARAGSDQVAEVDGLPVTTLAMSPRRPDQVLSAGAALRRMSASADVLHSVAISSLLPLVGSRPTPAWVHTEHWSGLADPDTLSQPLRWARRVVGPLLNRPDVVAVVSDYLAGQVAGFRTGPVRTVPNIVPAPGHLTDRAVTDADHGPIALVAVGGLIPRKRPDLAVRIVAALRDGGCEARLTWVGDGPLRGAVGALAEDLGVADRITWLGSVPPSGVGARLSAADVFLLPTVAETFCVAAAEALAHGRPVVVGDSGGPREFVAPPSGILVDGADPSAYARAVVEVLRASATLSADQIARPIRTRYSAAAYAARMDEVYAQALMVAGRRDRQ